MSEIVTYNIAKGLQDKNINIPCFCAYNKQQIINPDIIEKHGELSDDGYYELTKECGGDYEFDEVYIYKMQLVRKQDIIIRKNYTPAPMISQVLRHFRDDFDIHISIDIENGWFFTVKNISNEKYLKYYNKEEKYSSYEDCAMSAIEYVLDNHINLE